MLIEQQEGAATLVVREKHPNPRFWGAGPREGLERDGTPNGGGCRDSSGGETPMRQQNPAGTGGKDSARGLLPGTGLEMERRGFARLFALAPLLGRAELFVELLRSSPTCPAELVRVSWAWLDPAQLPKCPANPWAQLDPAHSLYPQLGSLQCCSGWSPCPVPGPCPLWELAAPLSPKSQNEPVWKKLLRSPSPTSVLTPPHQLNPGTECHVQALFKPLWGR